MQPVRVIATTAPTVQTPHAAPENPQTGLPLVLEYYLQIASLGASQDANYMKQLGEKGYRTQFDAAAAGRDARILVGPYSDESALRRARERLIASGVLAIEYIR